MNRIKERIDQLEMTVYCLSRPLFKSSTKNILVNGEEELFKVRAGGVVRWGIIHIKPVAVQPCGLSIRIYDSDGNLQISSGSFRLLTGENAISFPFYYKGTSELTVKVFTDGEVSIYAEDASAVVSGGKA